MPIRLRLTIWYILLLCSTLLLFGGALYGIVRYSLYNDVDRSLHVAAGAVVESLQFLYEANERAIVQDDPPKHGLEPPPLSAFSGPDIFIELRTRNGGVIEGSRNLGSRQLPLDTETHARLLVGESTLERTYFNGQPIRLYSAPVIHKGEIVHFVQVGRSLTDIERTLQQLFVFIASGIGLTLILATIVGAWLAERALAPVDAVTQAALRISRAEDLSRRLPPYQPADEIGRLIAAFNEMLGRLDDVFSDQQRFVADVSHELRTPLTALQGNIDLLKRGALEQPEARGEALDTIESEVARLNRLVADLLLLARADGGESLARQPVELDTLLLEVFRQGRILANASDHNLQLRLGHEDQATVIGDPDRLRQLLLNLVDNAVKYTQEGEIILSLWKDEAAEEVHISVQDTGIGIPADSLPLLFRRFYRADKARSRRLGGTGLGLAIVHWIVQAHNGSISVESEEGEGSTFTVTLPLPTPEALSETQVPTGGYHAIATTR